MCAYKNLIISYLNDNLNLNISIEIQILKQPNGFS